MQADKNLCGWQSGLEEGRNFAAFGRRFIEIAGHARGHRTSAFITATLNKMCLPAIILDRHGIVTETNATARAFLDWNINIKDNRLCIRDGDAYAELNARLEEITKPAQLKSIAEPIFVQRHKKLPVVLATIPLKEPMQSPEQEVHALVTLIMCRPDHGLLQRSTPRILHSVANQLGDR
jgi:hypothetical protein